MGGGHDGGVSGEAEVVVGREGHDVLSGLDEATGGAEGIEVAGCAPASGVAYGVEALVGPGRPWARFGRAVPRADGRGVLGLVQAHDPHTSVIDAASVSTMRPISASVLVSGGMRTMTSPSGRISTPRSTAAAVTSRPHLRSSAGGSSSTPVISPQRRTSLTPGSPTMRS